MLKFSTFVTGASLVLLYGCGADSPSSAGAGVDGAQGAGAATVISVSGNGGQVGGASVAGGSGSIATSGAAGVASVMGGANGGSTGTSGTSAGGATNLPDGGATGIDSAASKAALAQLQAWLALPAASRPPLASEPFASVALTKMEGGEARTLLLADYSAQLKAARTAEVGATETVAKTVTAGGVGMKYYAAKRGNKPATGWNLFISMHGGGDTDAATNDQQWQNQIALVSGYDPKNAIWVAPRAPTNEWNMWFKSDIDALFERLVQDLIAFEGVDPNHVYLNGYSAGGDGAYQLGTRMADSWAGVGMSAGHPNDASPLSLRDTAFAVHVGGNDTAFDRNKKAAEWGMLLDGLAQADPGGYVHQWQVHDGLPHWMNLADAVSIPFLQSHAREPLPKKVVWRQASTLRSRFYWLAVQPSDVASGSELTAAYEGQSVELSRVQGVSRLRVRVSDAMLDQDRPVVVNMAQKQLFNGVVPRTIRVLYTTLAERGDPALVFSGELTVDLK